MRTYPAAGCAVDTVLLPRPGISPEKWAVVACDQYTSQPGYWRAVDAQVGEAPSTLRITYPEVYLGKEPPEERIASIREHMRRYLAEGVFEAHDGLIYLEREAGAATRCGLMICLDLEQYDYTRGSRSLVRATEGTIVERLPPRMRIRDGAPLESPHIMVLVDDPDDTVFGGLRAQRDAMTPVYDLDLMMDSGHLRGWRVDDLALEEATMAALARLGDRGRFLRHYGLEGSDAAVLLYAMGDGNHSLATAKAIWEQTKERLGEAAMASPTRYALVELVNIYDVSLEFEPIHRVLFHLHRDLLADLRERFGASMTVMEVADMDALVAAVDGPGTQRFGLVTAAGFQVVELSEPPAELAVGSVQGFLDPWMKAGGAGELDYVHGTDVVRDLGLQPGNMGVYLPGMDKGDLFRSVILDGALPRKTFSMGEAKDKRFYMECRRIG
ncbi:MAG: DUF1015 domain-containing protein [Pseudomonadota bacterium]